MLKGLVMFLVAMILLIVADVWVAYRAIEPCEVLAIEQARRAGLPDQTTGTEGMSAGQCVGGLLDSWADRLKAWMS